MYLLIYYFYWTLVCQDVLYVFYSQDLVCKEEALLLQNVKLCVILYWQLLKRDYKNFCFMTTSESTMFWCQHHDIFVMDENTEVVK